MNLNCYVCKFFLFLFVQLAKIISFDIKYTSYYCGTFFTETGAECCGYHILTYWHQESASLAGGWEVEGGIEWLLSVAIAKEGWRESSSFNLCCHWNMCARR